MDEDRGPRRGFDEDRGFRRGFDDDRAPRRGTDDSRGSRRGGADDDSWGPRRGADEERGGRRDDGPRRDVDDEKAWKPVSRPGERRRSPRLTETLHETSSWSTRNESRVTSHDSCLVSRVPAVGGWREREKAREDSWGPPRDDAPEEKEEVKVEEKTSDSLKDRRPVR